MGPLKSGGGVQLAYNFLDELVKVDTAHRCFYLLVPEGGFKEYYHHPKIEKVITSPRSIVGRFIFDNTTLQRFLKKEKITKIFTFFGSGLPHPSSIQSIVGVAYPSICYDDSPFWNYISFRNKTKIKIINYFWKRRLKKANKIFTETVVMKKRLLKVIAFKEQDVFIIPPSPTQYISAHQKVQSERNILLLSGTLLQKNLWRLYEVALALKEQKFAVKFMLTISEKEWRDTLRIQPLNKEIIRDYFEFLGAVQQKEIAKVYDKADVLLLLSDLESFSNNHMEAWKVGIPQIVSDRDFTRAVCKDSALYVEPHHPAEVASAIRELLSNISLQKELVEKGKICLHELPSQEQRLQMIFKLILD